MQKYPSRMMSSTYVLTHLTLWVWDTLGLTCSPCDQVLQLQFEKEQELGHVSSQTKFNYAWGLVKSPKKEQQVEGVGLLQGLFPASFAASYR